GVTFSREHLVPVSWLGTGDPTNSYAGIESDLFELRPINPGVNSSRSNTAYGTGSGANGFVTPLPGYATGLYYAGDTDSGEVARSMFYMATRYYTGAAQASLSNLQLINGQPANGSFQVGDLASLLKNNYAHGVDNFERRRNQMIYSSSANPTYFQGNRNPYIDHPEYVWAVFGGGNNNSQIHLGAAGSADTTDGASSVTSNQRVIRGSALANFSFNVTKDNANPTTYDLTATNGATVTEGGVSALGTGQAFDYNNVTRNLTAAFDLAATSTVGLKTSTVRVHNTDLTTSGTGYGAGDGDDVVTLNATVLDHSTASFSGSTVESSATLDFGTIQKSGGKVTVPLSLFNLGANPAYTAALDIDSILSATGATSLLTTTIASTSIAGGSWATFAASFDPTAAGPGAFDAYYTIGTSDENIVGGYLPNSQPLTLHLTGVIAAVPEPATLGLMAVSGGLLLLRRKGRRA
ncbi:MAG: endonuclease, partial [Phycisphaerae bacterium]